MRVIEYQFARLLGACSIAVAAASCSGTVSEQETTSVMSVVVTPNAFTLLVGQQQPVSAEAHGADGKPVSGAAIVWSVKDQRVASVSSSGVVTALAVGVTELAASYGGRSGIAAITVTRAPIASVVILPHTVDALVGSRTPLTVVAYDAGGNTLTDRSFVWASSNSGVATVDNAGIVTAIGPGAATVTATAEGKSDGATITVTQTPVATITVTPPLLAMSAGQTTQLTATARDAAGNVLTGRAVQWTTSNSAVATVASDGLVTAKADGSATITATIADKSGSASVSVGGTAVSSVTVQPTTATVTQNLSQQLSATVRDVNNAIVTRPVTWSSSDPNIATVSQSGVVTGVTAGDVTITATSESKSGTARITVVRGIVAAVNIDPATATIVVGKTVPFTASVKDAFNLPLPGRVVTWTSSNIAVARVSSSGDVTAVAPGTVIITATCEGVGGIATVSVTLTPVGSVTVLPTTANLTTGQTTTLSVTVRDVDGNIVTNRQVTWTSNAPGVAAVSSTGVVSGVGPGTATITAASEGKSGTSTITVTLAPVATITLQPSTATLVVGTSTTLVATTKDDAGNVLIGRVVTWSLSDESIVNVTPNGVVTGVSVGTGTITATSEGKTATAIINVVPVPVATVVVQPSTANVAIGGTTTLTAFTRDASGNVLTGRAVAWTSSNTAVATVSSAGVVTGVAAGSTTITATSEGKSGTATVTVP